MTIHKSQGQTLDEAYILTKGRDFFEDGMLYVALSRVKTLKGIFLDREITEQDVKTSDRVEEFLNTNSAPISELQQVKEKLASTEAELQKALARIKQLEDRNK